MRTLACLSAIVSVAITACSAATPEATRGEATGHVGQALLSPTETLLSHSAIFRQAPTIGGTQIATDVLDTTFFASGGTIATMGAEGYTLVDVDIDTSTGRRLYSAVFQSGVPSTQYWELLPPDFASKVAALSSQGIRLVAFRNYVSPGTGQLFYAGVFQQGPAQQLFPGDMDWPTFESAVSANASQGYLLSNVTVFQSASGQERFAGVFTSYAPGARYAYWVSGWNSLAAQNRQLAGSGLRLVSLAHWERDGDRRYAGVWLPGEDSYDLVSATTADVLARKVAELAAQGKVPVRIAAERGYQPPAGLASSFNDHLDSVAIGYTYGVAEKGTVTAVGELGYARAPWEALLPSVAMEGGASGPTSAGTRLDVGSVSKLVAAASMLKLYEEQSNVFTLDTPILDILRPALNGAPAGAGVAQVTIRQLLNMTGGICEGRMVNTPGGPECVLDTTPACSANHFNDYAGWLNCALQNCTIDTNPASPTFQHCGTPPFNYNYTGPDYGALRGVIEHLSGETFEQYASDHVLVPTSANFAGLAATDLRNVNCQAYTGADQPLYYFAGETSGAGSPEQSTLRDVTVCGTGGMQFTGAQGIRFLNGMTHGAVLSSADQSLFLSLNPMNRWDANTGTPLYSALVGEGYTKNGFYTLNGNQGQMAAAFFAPAIDTQVNVFLNTHDTPTVELDAEKAIIEGIDRMYTFPRLTTYLRGRDIPLMCFNVSGDSRSGNAPIIEWPCGTAPIANNMRFVYIDVGGGRFMLQGVDSGMCVTVQFNDSNPGESMLQYPCNGLPNQQFVFKLSNHGYGNVIAQNSGMCMTLQGPTGSNIVQEPCAGLVSQDFKMPEADY